MLSLPSSTGPGVILFYHFKDYIPKPTPIPKISNQLQADALIFKDPKKMKDQAKMGRSWLDQIKLTQFFKTIHKS